MIKDYPGSLYGRYRNPKFTDVYDNVEDFLADYKDVGIPTSISDESATTLYFLLYGKYGNTVLLGKRRLIFRKLLEHGQRTKLLYLKPLVVNLHTTLTLLVVLRTRHKVRLVTHQRLLGRTILRQQLLLALL